MKRTIKIVVAVALAAGATALAQTLQKPVEKTTKATTQDGNIYVPYESRTGNESIVYFTRDLSSEGLIKAYKQVCANMTGNIGIKLHTGEQNGPNIIPRGMGKSTGRARATRRPYYRNQYYYEGDRYTTEQHRKTLQVNGWTFCPRRYN